MDVRADSVSHAADRDLFIERDEFVCEAFDEMVRLYEVKWPVTGEE